MSADIEQNEDIDILEQEIQDISSFLLKILLQDKTTGRFIRFACDEYLKYGEAYAADKEILPNLIIGKNTKLFNHGRLKVKTNKSIVPERQPKSLHLVGFAMK